MRLKHLLSVFLTLLTLSVGQMWGATETYTYSDYTGQGTPNSGSSYTMTKTYSSIGDTKFNGGASYGQFFASGVTTITPLSNATITQVVLTAFSSSYNGYQSSGTVTANYGSVTKTNNTTVTWTGSRTAAFTITHNKQIRWTQIVVTYTAAASCSTPPTVGTNLTSVSATANSITATVPISSIGGCNITENGLVYSTTTATPTVGGTSCTKVTTTACGATAANKTVTISELTCGTTYYVRGFATNGANTSYTNVTTQATSACPKYTVTLKDDDTELEQQTAGASITLPSRAGCTGYTFAGWSTSNCGSSEITTPAPTVIPAGSYTPTANVDLYPVYTRTEGTQESWDLVSAANNVTAGTYVITWDNSYYLPSETAAGSNPSVGSGITQSNNKLTNTVTSAMQWTFTGDNTNGYVISHVSGNNTYKLSSTNAAQGISVTTGSTDRKWTASVHATYGMLLHGDDGGTRYLAVYNNSGTRTWRYYAAGASYDGTLRLYKKTGGSTTYYISAPNCCDPLGSINGSVSLTYFLNHLGYFGINPKTPLFLVNHFNKSKISFPSSLKC